MTGDERMRLAARDLGSKVSKELEGSDWWADLQQRASHRRNVRKATVAAVAASFVLAAALIGSTIVDGARRATPQPVSPVVPSPPLVGQCHRYDFFAFSQSVEDSRPVSCDTAHNSVTVAVIQPDGIAIPYDDSNKAAQAALAACQPPVNQLTGVGAGVQFSRLLGAVFRPSGPQLMAGQRWLRCDLVEVRPRSRELQTLSGPYSGVLAAGPNLSDALCVTRSRWTEGLDGDPTFMGWANLSDCTVPGSAVAVRTAEVQRGNDNWPGAASASQAAAQACVSTASRFVGLKLESLPPSRTMWPRILCVADVSQYREWVSHGKQLGGR